MLSIKDVDKSLLPDMLLDYVSNKEMYMNDVVLFRVGDFYEAYFDDAVYLSSTAGITLTSKKIAGKQKTAQELEDEKSLDGIKNSKLLVPMAGVPHRTLKIYAAKIIQSGKRVVVVEQLENPKDVKGRNIKRGVVAIMTAIDLNDDISNNFLCIVYHDTFGNNFSLCFADIYTGDIYLTTVDTIDNVLNEIVRYKPHELLITEEVSELLTPVLKNNPNLHMMVTVEDRVFTLNNPVNQICKAFHINSVDSIKYNNTLELKCLSVLLNYVEYTHKSEITFGSLPECYLCDSYMSIDMASRNNLELCENIVDKGQKNTLYSVLNTCKTSMGSREMKQWIEKPLLNRASINRRLRGVSELVSDPDYLHEIRNSLIGIMDISRIIGRLKLNKTISKDFVNLRDSLLKMPQLKLYLNKFQSDILKSLYYAMDDYDALAYLLESAFLDDPATDIKEGLVIKSGYNSKLDEARDMIENSNQYISAFEERERLRTGIKNLKVVNRDGLCMIEVKSSNANKVPSDYRIEKSLKNDIRYMNDESEQLGKNLYSAIERSKAIEIELYEEIKSIVLNEVEKLTTLANIIAEFDCLCSLANVAVNNHYTCPNINMEGILEIKGGRHPVVELLTESEFIDNDIFMDMSSDRFLLITGPNMAGKSTYMRQTALITIMAHLGSFVPANYANIPLTDKIFTRIGASDNISSGQSTYMVEMVEVKNILDNATSKSLVLLDEVGRGTSTVDGLSMAQSITEYIHNKIGCKTLFATHYHELIDLEKSLDGLKNYHMSVTEENNSIVFLRKIQPGGLSNSYGIDVAKLAGIPEEVIARAWEVYENLEHHNVLLDSKSENVYNAENLFDKSGEVMERLRSIKSKKLSPLDSYKYLIDLLELV